MTDDVWETCKHSFNFEQRLRDGRRIYRCVWCFERIISTKLRRGEIGWFSQPGGWLSQTEEGEHGVERR